MKKLTTLIIIASVFLTGCVTTGSENQLSKTSNENMEDATWFKTANPENYIVNKDSVFVGDKKILSIGTDFTSGESYHLNLEFFDETHSIHDIRLEVVVVLEDRTESVITGFYPLVDGKVKIAAAPIKDNVKRYEIMELQIFYNSGNQVWAKKATPDDWIALLDTPSGETYKTNKGVEPIKSWINKGNQLLLITEQDKLSILNLDTYKKTLISRVASEWIDNQPKDGIKLSLDFTDETGGLIQYLNAGAKFYESNMNWGGETNNFESSERGLHNTIIGTQDELRGTIRGWSLIVNQIDLISGIVKSLPETQRSELNLHPGFVFIGDRNNPFSLIKHSEKAPESWVSDFRKTDIIWQGNLVTAVNKETGEEVDLIRISTEWTPANGDTGDFSFTFEDLSGGLVTGGSIRTTFNFGEYLPKGNQFIGAYRFDGEETTTDHQYISGNKPSLTCSILVKKPERLESAPLRDSFGTISFKDGNVLLFHYVENL